MLPSALRLSCLGRGWQEDDDAAFPTASAAANFGAVSASLGRMASQEELKLR